MGREDAIAKLQELFEELLREKRAIYPIFVDLCDSTAYKKSILSQGLSDSNWLYRQLIFLQSCAKILRRYGCTVVKTIGDEVFGYFDADADPDQILTCSHEIIATFTSMKAFDGAASIHAKISVDFGFTYNGSIQDNIPYDPIGTPVDRCARLNKVAKADHVVVSADYRRSLLRSLRKQDIVSEYVFKKEQKDIDGLGPTTFYILSVE